MWLSSTVRRMREERKLRQTDLAELTGLTQGYISKIETGHCVDPPLSVVIRIADVFGVTVNDIIEAAKEDYHTELEQKINKLLG